MATHGPATLRQPNASRPDASYALITGLCAAALFAPAVVLALSRLVADAAVLYISFLAAVTGVTAVAGRTVSRVSGLTVTLGRHDTVWLLVALPFCWLGGASGAAAVGVEPPAITAPLAVVGTAGGMLLGLVLVSMSRTRYADAVLEERTDRAEWEARWPRRWRRVAGGVAASAFAASTIGISLTPVMNSRTFRLTDAGLVIERPLQRQFRPWSAFTGYELTDDALVVRPAAWWRPAHRCDRGDIDDIDAAVAALEEQFSGRR